MRAAARHGTWGIAVRPSGLMLLAADDLDELGQREPEQLVVIEVKPLLAFAEVDGLGCGLAQVPQPDPVVRPHRAGGRWR